MNTASTPTAPRIVGRRRSMTLVGSVFGIVLLVLAAVVQVTPVFAGFAVESPVSVAITGGELGTSAGLMPGDRITLTPIVIEAAGGDMLYALHADVVGPDALIRQLQATALTTDGSLLYDGPLAGLSIGSGALGSPQRPLAAGTTEPLSITIAVSIDAGNEIEGTALAVTWRADAIAAVQTTESQ